MLAALLNLGFGGSGVVSTTGVPPTLVISRGPHVIDHVRRRRSPYKIRFGTDIFGDGLEFDENGKISIIGPSGLWSVTAVKTAGYTTTYDELVRSDPSAGAFTVTLPTAASVAGRQIAIKNVTGSGGHITLTPDGSETIDGLSSVTMFVGYESLTIVSDGTNWIII